MVLKESFRVAWGAHGKHVKEVPPALRKINEALRKIRGGHQDLWVMP
jgi:hypothetical protein